MANVGYSVNKSLHEFDQGDLISAMIHACNAVDGTSKKSFPEMHKHGKRFTRLLRESYAILGPFGIPGIDLVNTRWPVDVGSHVPDKLPDAADVIYGIHRCIHNHGEDMPDGFELVRCANGASIDATTVISKGRVRLPDNIIFGLLAVAITSPKNSSQIADDSCYLTFRDRRFAVNDLWGQRDELISILSEYKLPVLRIDFAHMMDLHSVDQGTSLKKT